MQSFIVGIDIILSYIREQKYVYIEKVLSSEFTISNSVKTSLVSDLMLVEEVSLGS